MGRPSADTSDGPKEGSGDACGKTLRAASVSTKNLSPVRSSRRNRSETPDGLAEASFSGRRAGRFLTSCKGDSTAERLPPTWRADDSSPTGPVSRAAGDGRHRYRLCEGRLVEEGEGDREEGETAATAAGSANAHNGRARLLRLSHNLSAAAANSLGVA